MNRTILHPICFEDYKKDDSHNEFSLSELHWALLFRRFDVVNELLSDAEKSGTASEQLHFRGMADHSWLTPLVCARWNWEYILAYDENKGTRIAEIIEESSKDDKAFFSYDPTEYYESVKDSTIKQSIFDIVWGNVQPMLSVIRYEKQMIASRQVKENGFSLVLDEVGTGKTVAALYALRDVIEEAANEGRSARILIVCPYSKRGDWQNDLRRQLGRYAHIVEQGEEGELYLDHRKEVFFRKDEHVIIIAGQKQSENDKEGSHSALKGSLEKYAKSEKWDIVVIDESHQSFDNFQNIRANRAMLLTATPIVVSGRKVRSFPDYYRLLKTITGQDAQSFYDEQNPITIREPNAQNWFVNWFREDMGKKAAKRNIRFVTCERSEDRWAAYQIIKEFKGPLAALHADQDDTYLFDKANAILEENCETPFEYSGENKKLDVLVDLLNGGIQESDKKKSFLIFCEHLSVSRQVYEKIKNSVDTDCMIGLKTGNEETFYPDRTASGMLIDDMANAHRDGIRTILVTTGKKSGVGLNLGWFDGVIHYELPFTSIELEQQFGRVDRIDVTGNTDAALQKDMIFLLNESDSQDDNLLRQNPMLEYCVTKLDVTCKQMPVRNTVLFTPDFYKPIISEKIKSLEKMKSNIEKAISEGMEAVYNDAEHRKSQLYTAKRKSKWDSVKSLCDDATTAPLSICEYVLRQCDKAQLEEMVGDEYLNVMADYMGFANSNAQSIETWTAVKREYKKLKRETIIFLLLFGKESFGEKEYDIFYAEPAMSDVDVEAETYEKDRDIGEAEEDTPQMQTIEPETEDDIKETAGEKMCEEIDVLCKELNQITTLSSDGIYWYQGRIIHSASVGDFRKGRG